MKIAVIGAGIFGLSAALELSSEYEVYVFESNGKILGGASYANHNRHHYGFHYPRSNLTAQQCLNSKESFEQAYGDCLFRNFLNYYAVAKKNSYLTFDEYLKFVDQMNLKYEIVPTPKELFNPNEIEGCIRAHEYVYDFELLKNKLERKIYLAGKNLKIKLNTKVINVVIAPNNQKIVTVERIDDDNSISDIFFDVIVDATYGATNHFRGWLNGSTKSLQHNLQELAIIEMPNINPVGLTVMDGMFPSILPLGNSPYFLFAHAEHSQLKRKISSRGDSLLNQSLYIETNWSATKSNSEKYITALKDAKYIKSIIVDRVVDTVSSISDDRISEISYMGHQCWSIFSAKVITSVEIAKKLLKQIQQTV
jgi:hypothetical protein